MAKLTIKLDKRKANKAGEYPIKIQLHHRSKAVNISLGVAIFENHWNGENDVTRVVKSSCPNARKINESIANVYFTLHNRPFKLDADNMDVESIKQKSKPSRKRRTSG